MRRRQVLVLAALGLDALRPRVVECWERRYRCVRCRAVQPVLPRGVMPRFLYSIPAIVFAFFLVVATPVGSGLSDGEAYARQGMYDVKAWRDSGPYRWRSIERWFEKATQWWPGGYARDLAGLLTGWLQRGIGPDTMTDDLQQQRRLAIGAAVASHVRWGAAM